MTKQKTVGRIIQPNELFDMLNVKNREEAERVLSNTLYFLLYMRVGDKLSTSVADFNKIGPDLIQLDYAIDANIVADELVKKRIIKLPI